MLVQCDKLLIIDLVKISGVSGERFEGQREV